MADRYATIITDDEGEEVISSIAQMEGVPPEVRDDQRDRISVEKVADGVLIGMVRGGPVSPVGGFDFPEGYDQVRSGIGTTRNRDALGGNGGTQSNPNAKGRYASDGTGAAVSLTTTDAGNTAGETGIGSRSKGRRRRSGVSTDTTASTSAESEPTA